MITNRQSSSLFPYLLALTLVFILFEISFFIATSKTYYHSLSLFANWRQILSSLAPGIVFFICGQLLLHLTLCIFVWWESGNIARLLKLSPEREFTLGIALWFLTIVTLLLANTYYFPQSRFAELMIALLSFTGAKILFWLCLSASVAGLAIACLSDVGFLLIVGLFIWIFFPSKVSQPLTNPATAERPNVILVGVDSLRPDYLGFWNGPLKTPFMDSFLQQATVFNEAMTPLARTYPSWVAILAGQHPKDLGIRSNLSAHNIANPAELLPEIFQREGYDTVYATDETRFSNIDKRFGFQQVITPPIGIYDFIFGTFNDFPLSNLISNTRLGRILFPDSYGNRGADFVYKPNTFLGMVAPALQQARTQPLFMVIHFCLPHFPYRWSETPLDITPREKYRVSIERVDMQLQAFFAMLAANHLLDHAIVVLLSDHGEALDLPGDRVTAANLYIAGANNPSKKIPEFYPPGPDQAVVDESVGHGTDVLGLTQYRSLLAFRTYGMAANKAERVGGYVSLLDIKPTLLALLQFKPALTSGLSLAPIIRGQQNSVMSPRDIFLETDFSPQAVHSIYPDIPNVLLEAAAMFTIDQATKRLLLRPEAEEMIIASKQYADIYGDWMLALYPQQQGQYIAILVNLKTGQWTDDLNTDFAKQSPAAQMLERLQAFYGVKSSFACENC